jgi:hypothetical protein
MQRDLWPSWRYGPKGEAEIFQCEADVPEGWEDHPSKLPKSDDPDSADREELMNALRAANIEFDGRWSDKRLRALLA